MESSADEVSPRSTVEVLSIMLAWQGLSARRGMCATQAASPERNATLYLHSLLHKAARSNSPLDQELRDRVCSNERLGACMSQLQCVRFVARSCAEHRAVLYACESVFISVSDAVIVSVFSCLCVCL